MIELIGWVAYILVIAAFSCNAIKRPKTALSLWILGDILWILYNIMIWNLPHMAMNFTIILINIYGLTNYFNETKDINENS